MQWSNLQIDHKKRNFDCAFSPNEITQKKIKVGDEALAKRQAAQMFLQFLQVTDPQSCNVFEDMIPSRVSKIMNSGVPNIEIFLLKHLLLAMIKRTVELANSELKGKPYYASEIGYESTRRLRVLREVEAEFDQVVFLEENLELTAKLQAVKYLFVHATQLEKLDNYFKFCLERKLSDQTSALELAATKLVILMYEKRSPSQYKREARDIIIRSTYPSQKSKKKKAIVKSTPLVIELTPPKHLSERQRELILKRRKLPR